MAMDNLRDTLRSGVERQLTGTLCYCPGTVLSYSGLRNHGYFNRKSLRTNPHSRRTLEKEKASYIMVCGGGGGDGRSGSSSGEQQCGMAMKTSQAVPAVIVPARRTASNPLH